MKFGIVLAGVVIVASGVAAADVAVPAASAAARRPAAASARASAPARSASAAAKAPLLTPAEARDCLDAKKKESLQAQHDDALKEKAQIDSDKAEIARLGTALADEVAVLDKSDQVQVDAYNDKVAARDKQIEAYQARVTAFNAKAASLNSAEQARNTDCSGRSYDERKLATPKAKK